MDIDTKRLLTDNRGIRVAEFVKVREQISLCTEFKPWIQEGKFNSIFVLFQLRSIFDDPIVMIVPAHHLTFSCLF